MDSNNRSQPVAPPKTSMDSSQSEALPSDMVFEVLSRTHLQTTDTCKAVSKEWKQLISSSAFMASDSKNTGNLFGYIVQNLVACKHVHRFVSPNKTEGSFSISPFKSDDLKIEASSVQGILCCVRNIGLQYRYYVCKPSTRQWQALPNPKRTHSAEKVGLVVLSSHPLRYKIFRLSKPRFWRSGCNWDYRCEIFDSRTWAWKQGEDVILLGDNHLLYRHPAVYASGLVCFQTKDYILAFLADEETSFIIPLPELSCKNDTKKMVEYQGKLGLISETTSYTEFWVLKDWKIGTWEMTKRLDIGVLQREVCYPHSEGLYNSESLFTSSYFAVEFWDLKDFSFNEIKLPDIVRPYRSNIFPFRSDWEPVNLKEEKVFAHRGGSLRNH